MNAKSTGPIAGMACFVVIAGLIWIPACTQPEPENALGERDAPGAETRVPAAAPQEREEVQEGALKLPAMPDAGPGIAQRMGDTYWYIPYATANEKQMLAFIDAYSKYIEQGEPPPEELKVPEGEGAAGSDTLYRLREGVTDLFIKDIRLPGKSAVSQSDIPVIISLPKHGNDGALVLFMDGHVRFVPYGTFPVTERIIDGLKKLDPLEHSAPE